MNRALALALAALLAAAACGKYGPPERAVAGKGKPTGTATPDTGNGVDEDNNPDSLDPNDTEPGGMP